MIILFNLYIRQYLYFVFTFVLNSIEFNQYKHLFRKIEVCTLSLMHVRFNLTADFPAIFRVLHLPRLRVSAPRNATFQYCGCLSNGKFIITTFRSRFHVVCLESFTRADSTPKWRILAFVRKANCNVYRIHFCLSILRTLKT